MRPLHAFVLLVAIVATVASATRLVPPPGSTGPAPSASVRSAPPEPEQKPAFDVRQAPVPIRWTYRHEAIAAPEEEDRPSTSDVVIPATPGQTGDQAVDQSADQTTSDQTRMGQAAAKAAIETDGYKGVTDLAQAPNGEWTARALRGATVVNLTVASDGSISAN